MSYLTRLSQAVTVDSNNSSLSNLAAGAYFIGLPTSTTGVAGLQVCFKSDQNATIYIEQTRGLTAGVGTVTTSGTDLTGTNTKFLRDFKVGDQIVIAGEATTRYIATIVSDTVATITATATGVTGANYTFYPYDQVDTYNYYASIDNFSVTVQAVNAYWRVRILNTGTATTTYLRLDSVLCPIIEALPRSVDASGYLKVKNYGLVDDFGFSAMNTPNGELRAIEPVRLVGTGFGPTTIDTTFWTATTANSATVASSGEAVLTSGTNSAGSAQLHSVRRARYIGGASNRARIIIQLGDTGQASNTRRWGVVYGASMPTFTDGAYFQLAGTTFSVVTVNGGSATTVSSGSFNGALGGTYAPTTSVATYEIYWNNSKVYFIVNGIILHTVNASTAKWSATLTLHLYLDNINSGNTTSVTLTCRTATIYRLGRLTTATIWRNIHGANAGTQLKLGSGTLHSVTVNGWVNGTIISLYDATSTTNPIALIVPTAGTQPTIQPFSLPFPNGLDFYTGLYVVTANASTDVTISFE
jgi:hypothetical protein